MKQLFNSFSDFVNWCKIYADNIHTMMEWHTYSEYQFGTVAFMTDKFGGVYCNFNYDFTTGKIINWLGMSIEHEAVSEQDLRNEILTRKREEESKRDLNEISDMINSEY